MAEIYVPRATAVGAAQLRRDGSSRCQSAPCTRERHSVAQPCPEHGKRQHDDSSLNRERTIAVGGRRYMRPGVRHGERHRERPSRPRRLERHRPSATDPPCRDPHQRGDRHSGRQLGQLLPRGAGARQGSHGGMDRRRADPPAGEHLLQRPRSMAGEGRERPRGGGMVRLPAEIPALAQDRGFDLVWSHSLNDKLPEGHPTGAISRRDANQRLLDRRANSLMTAMVLLLAQAVIWAGVLVGS
jgi:hypothetical protein